MLSAMYSANVAADAPPSLLSLPRCRPSRPLVDEIRRAGDWLRKGGAPMQTCAVVGSSDMLRLDPRGSEIDGHGFVIRLNNAPTRGWERAVGNRTSLRVVNHVPIEKWVRLASDPAALAETADGDEYEERLCAPEATSYGCVISRMHAPSAFERSLAVYRQRYASHMVRVIGRAVHSWGVQCNHEIGGTSPSGGLFAVLLALATCETPITVYGFWPFCCHARHRAAAFSAALHYKYHQGNRTRFVCCSAGRERMEVEFELYEALARHGVVKLVLAPEAHASRLTRSSGTGHGTPAKGSIGGRAPLARSMVTRVPESLTRRHHALHVQRRAKGAAANAGHPFATPSARTRGSHSTELQRL